MSDAWSGCAKASASASRARMNRLGNFSIGLACLVLLAAGSGRTAEGEPALPTFDRVAKAGREVTYEEVASFYGGPMSRAPVFSVKAHPEIAWVRPDMGIGMVANPMAFAVAPSPEPIRWRRVERSLRRGYLPIVISRYRNEGLIYEQEAFATLLHGQPVRTGFEKQVAIVRMSVRNPDPAETRRATLWAFVPATVATTDREPFFWSYRLFEVTGSLPDVPTQPLKEADGTLRNGPTLLGLYDPGPGVKVTAFEKVLKFEMELLPGQTMHTCFKLSTNKKGLSVAERDHLREVDIRTALDRRVLELEGILSQGTQIQSPEEIVNNIYKAQVLYNQPQMVQAADRDYYMPVQGYEGVWPWEEMKMLVHLDAAGYGEDVRRSLDYFIKTQSRQMPHGQVTSSEGVFGGTGAFEESGWETDAESTIYGVRAKGIKPGQFFAWMNWTGAVLYTFAEHYFYTNDKEWLRGVAPHLIKACDWIIGERHKTRQHDERGRKVLHYGLLPAGQAYDTRWDKPDHYIGWTDGYTSQGFSRIAEALADIAHPEAARLVKEAAEYRADLQEVMRRVRQTGDGQPPYPERLYQKPDWADFATGPLAFLDTGFLRPEDPAFLQLEEYMKKHFNRGVLGLTGCLANDGTTGHRYYVDFSEDIWQRAWILRGEVEKSLLAFYSTLAYGVDKQTLGAVERFDLYDQRYTPFYMDGSGASRVVGMVRQSILLENDRVLHLLGGAPRRWLEDGKIIQVRGATTYFGKMDLHVSSEVDQGKIVVDLNLRRSRPERLDRIRLRIPHPDRRAIRQVMVDGQALQGFDPDRGLIELKAQRDSYRIVVLY